MRKKLDTRFPAARIKKIMQADEDVGKIAMAVPLLVSKALELFLQDLCNRTYDITLKRGAKTVNSVHLKQCVHTFNVFDFLRDIVGKVPDLGSLETASGEDRSATKRRKVADEGNFSDEEMKTPKVPEVGHTGGGRARGRGRGRGRGRVGGRTGSGQNQRFVDDMADISPLHENQSPSPEKAECAQEQDASMEKVPAQNYNNSEMTVRNFDLNVELDENGEFTAPQPQQQLEEFPGSPLLGFNEMRIDHEHLSRLNKGMDMDDEDYDEES